MVMIIYNKFCEKRDFKRFSGNSRQSERFDTAIVNIE